MAVLVLALGIGPTTAIFSLASQLLWRPIPGVEAPGTLAMVRFATPVDQRDFGRGFAPRSISYLNHADLVAGVPALAGLAGYEESEVSVAVENTLPRRVGAAFVMSDYFGVLGLRFVRGRAFTRDEDLEPGGTPVPRDHRRGSSLGAGGHASLRAPRPP